MAEPEEIVIEPTRKFQGKFSSSLAARAELFYALRKMSDEDYHAGRRVTVNCLYREGYELYDNKPCLDDEPTQCASCLENRLRPIGRSVGWNMSGSSRRWLRRNGRPDEAVPEGLRTKPLEGRRIIPIAAGKVA